MINFRFHLVSLVAVFLALAIGIVMGYGVLGQPTIEGLQNRIDTVEANANARREENAALSSRIDQANASIDASAPFAVTDRLAGVAVTVIAVRDVDQGTVERVIGLARTAGADVAGIAWLEPRLALPTRADDQAMASILGLPSTTKRVDLRQAFWRSFSARLATGPATGIDDVLADLVAGEFVSLDGVGGDDPTAADIAPNGSSVALVVARGAALGARGVIDDASTAAAGQRLALAVGFVGSTDASRDDPLAPVRDSDELRTQVTTIDDLDLAIGGVATVLGLADLGRGVVGHYGIGTGADRILPAWTQP